MGVKEYLFAIFAVTAVLAFIGADSASATVLCNEPASECTSYEKGASLSAFLTGSTTLSTTGGTLLDTCTLGMSEGTTSSAGGSSETVSESIEELTWESCTNTTDTVSNGELEIHSISGTNNGTVTGKNISVTVNTAFGSCTYGTGTAIDLGTLVGGSPAMLEVNTILSKTAGGLLCPSEAEWAASYALTSPEPLYVGQKSAAATAPMIKVRNIGGVPTRGTDLCNFSAFGEVCELKVTNESLFALTITQEEFIQQAERYKFITKCGIGNEIAAKNGFCVARVKLEVKPGKMWRDGYFIRVKQQFKLPANYAASRGYLNTP
jgi:hypothetical protein